MADDRCSVTHCSERPSHEVTFDTGDAYKFCRDHAWPFWKDYSRHTIRVLAVKDLGFSYF